ncbi:MAG: hypothetical protein JSW38_05400 [Dehalococcoidia bacterium]|nr:MAG: hypothetical protein JSV02_09980 [Dehalococcoidia bacterium]UCG84248.1 MAG: hypothetical protein JSW38_05400 [Dehalococcoidia bacterium]
MKKMGFVLIALLAVVTLFAVGCGGDEETSPTGSPAVTQPPGGTLAPTVTQPPGPIPTFAPGEVDPVSFNDLLPFLPEPPPGWEADEPFGGTYQMQEWWWSQVDRDYNNLSTGEYVDISIFDSAYYYGFAWWATMEYAVEWETTEGYAKKTTFKGHRAWKMYDKPDSYSLWVAVSDRFMVMVNAETEGSLNQFANLINYNGIAALK